MGRYTELARKYKVDEPQEGGRTSVGSNTYVNINNNLNKSEASPLENKPSRRTNLRTTNLTNLKAPASVDLSQQPYVAGSSVRCIHNTTPDRCAVCSGYARWLGSDEARLLRAQRDPDGVRREFWREAKGGPS